MTGSRALKWISIVTVLALAGAACSDDGGSDAEAAPDLAAFCKVATAIPDQTEPPSDEQLDQLASTAPDEIRDAAETTANGFRDIDPESQPSDELVGAVSDIVTFTQQNCGDEAENDDGAEDIEGVEAGSGADLAAFCELQGELDESADIDDLTGEVLDTLTETAPAEIAPDMLIVADGFKAANAGDDAALSDPEFEASLEALEEFVGANCA